jgi:nickel-dependent lactate racemase
MSYPRMMQIRQHFKAPGVEDVVSAVRDELSKLDLSRRIKPDDTVAITAGSRGIANIALIVKTLVEELKKYGARPFIVPAMGSHGGGTAEGQRAIIEGYGITEEYVGAPIKASMDAVQVGTIEDGVPVFFDKYAYQADHVVVVNRVKPHTS